MCAALDDSDLDALGVSLPAPRRLGAFFDKAITLHPRLARPEKRGGTEQSADSHFSSFIKHPDPLFLFRAEPSEFINGAMGVC